MIPISNIARLRSRLATTLGAGLVLVVAGGACASTPASDPGRIAAHRATLSAIGAVAEADAQEGRGVRVVLPARASDAVVVVDATSSIEARITLRGATDSDAKTEAGTRIYPGALRGSDVALVPREGGVEDFVFFDTKPAEESIVYDLDVSRVAGLRLVNRTLELLDRAGTPRLRALPPEVIDAKGARIAAEIAVEGCAVDTSEALPWDRAVTAPGASSCALRVTWGKHAQVAYPAVVDPSWQGTAAMPSPRYNHASIALASGRILVISGFYEPNGGMGRGADPAAYAYDPTTRTWAGAASIVNAREEFSLAFTGTGKVLVMGGGGSSRPEIYNPATGFSRSEAFTTTVSGLTTTSLPNGKILVAGGSNGAPVAAATLYDEAIDDFTNAGPAGVMGVARARHTATRLASGKVLLAGGEGAAGTTAEIYDPVTNTFAPTAGPMQNARSTHAAVLLADGRVILAGGGTATAELYDPTTNRFSPAGALSSARSRLRGVRLESGHALFAGGELLGGEPAPEVEVWDPATKTFAVQAPLTFPRTRFTLENLGTSAVIAIGGKAPNNTSVLVPEIWTPLAQGSACTLADDCKTGFCQEGYCCAVACPGPCKTCTSGAGACVPVTNADDPDSCTGNDTCDAVGACKKKNGRTCGAATECASGSCVDGFCCERACGGQCEACDVAGNEGRCLPVAGESHGARPRCASGDAKCGGACNGISPTCAFPSAVTTCSQSCSGKLAIVGTCDGRGACVVGSPQNCPGNFVCENTNVCKTSCAGDAECLEGYRCESARCVAIALCDGSVVRKGTETIDCGAYTCEQSGVCRTTCASVAECTAPNVCAADGTCALPPEPPDDGCAIGASVASGSGRASGGFVLFFFSLVALAVTRRRK